jgi:hypothetical protein
VIEGQRLKPNVLAFERDGCDVHGVIEEGYRGKGFASRVSAKL